MLVLTRKTDQSIVIGDQIRVSVIQIRGSRVKLAVDAPHEVSIRRQEIQGSPAHADQRVYELLGSGI